MPVATEDILNRAQRLLLENNFVAAHSLVHSVLRHYPDEPEALHLAGLIALSEADNSRAIKSLRRAAFLRPCAPWLQDLASTCFLNGDFVEAADILRHIVALIPDALEARLLLAEALLRNSDWQASLETAESITGYALLPRAMRLRGEAFFGLRRYGDCVDSLTLYFESATPSARVRNICAVAAILAARFDVAVEQRRHLLAIAGGAAEQKLALASALWCSGEMDECLKLADAVRKDCPDDEQANVTFLRALDHTSFSAAASRQAWHEWSAHALRSVRPLPSQPTDWSADRRLRIGHLVDDIHRRPNSYFVPPILRNRDTEHFHTVCYLASSEGGDEWKSLLALNPEARDCRGAPPEQIARLIQADRIDILVNASWEFRTRHLSVFAYHPAPVQIELPLYPATTGHPAVQYLFSDNWICPPGDEAMYSEQVRRLEHSYLPWESPSPAPPVTPLPMNANGFCTFGFFQKPSKLNPAVWDSICAILRAVPRSRLLMHHHSAELERPASPTRLRFAAELLSRGIEPHRVNFVGSRDIDEHFETMAQCDIALDSFPYNGNTTTGDCLWMGVPVVTLTCQTHAGRVGLSMLGRVGLDELAPSNPHFYVEIATALALDPPRLNTLRSTLRTRMAQSALTSGSKTMSAIEREFRFIWKEHCAAQPAAMKIGVNNVRNE